MPAKRKYYRRKASSGKKKAKPKAKSTKPSKARINAFKRAYYEYHQIGSTEEE